MKRALLAAAAFVSFAVTDVRAGGPTDNQRLIQGCLAAAAGAYRLPPAVLVILLKVEGGSLGRVSRNSNQTVDIGPMQVNEIWLPQLAVHWHATIFRTYQALRDDFCANVEAGAWILRQGLDDAHGNFWEGVGYYHSHEPEHKAKYLRSVLDQVLQLRSRVESTDRSPGPAPPSAADTALRTTLVAGN